MGTALLCVNFVFIDVEIGYNEGSPFTTQRVVRAIRELFVDNLLFVQTIYLKNVQWLHTKKDP
jgi:hypothetical protein